MARTSTIAILAILVGCASHFTGEDGGESLRDGMTDAGPPQPCETDADCDDGIACTEDVCVSGLCMRRLDHASCSDGVFCNGNEVCDPARGCVDGARETCNDGNVCTLDACDEASASCRHLPRDADADGDVDMFCEGGGDCDDTDPTVSSLADERCRNGKDDDCDGTIDETTHCTTAPHDTCADPLDVSAGGSFVVDARDLNGDYLGCGIVECRDFVARFTLTEPRDVEIIVAAEGDPFDTYTELALRTDCSDPSTDIENVTGFPATLARRSLQPGTYYVLAGAERSFGTGTLEELELSLDIRAPTNAPTNETCASPLDVGAGGDFRADFVDTRHDLDLGCGYEDGDPELVYSITLSARADLRITLDGFARLGLSLRTACEDTSSALRCVVLEPWQNRVLTFHDLPAGTYYLLLELQSIPETRIPFSVEVLPPTPTPAGDTCATAIPLALGETSVGSLSGLEDDVDGPDGCNDAREAVHVLELTEESDVWVRATGASGLGITLRDGCGATAASPGCNWGGAPTSGSMAGVVAYGVAPGRWFVTVEGENAETYHIHADAWPARTTAPMRVSGNDRCETATVIPVTGGRFAGTTEPAHNDYDPARCRATRARDVTFRLDLPARRRVIASTAGSSFPTVLHLHRDACRAGAELACDLTSAGHVDPLPNASVLDRVLDPGTYYFIVDGSHEFGFGEYVLDVAVLDAP